MELEMLSAFDTLPLSKPFEIEWLEAFKKRTESSRLVLVGTGVTGEEFSILFKKNDIDFIQISAHSFAGFARDNFEKKIIDKFYLFAAPSALDELKQHANLAGLVYGQNYFSYTQTLRNRLVIDLRMDGLCFDPVELMENMRQFSKIPSLAGIDILSSNSKYIEQIDPFLLKLRDKFHIKVVLYPLDDSHFDTSLIQSARVIELNCATEGINYQEQHDLLQRLQKTLRLDKRVILLANDSLIEIANTNRWENTFHERNHPEYYDEILEHLEAGVLIPTLKIKQGKACLSRRMFPVVDGHLRLKVCSLYGNLSKTNFKVDEITSPQFVANRERLCNRCISQRLHRMV